MKKVDSKQRLFEVMGRLDKTFKPNLNESEVEEGKMANLAAGIGMAAGTMFGGGAQAQQMASAAPMNKPGMEQSVSNDRYGAYKDNMLLGTIGYLITKDQHGSLDTQVATNLNNVIDVILKIKNGESLAGISPEIINLAKNEIRTFNKMNTNNQLLQTYIGLANSMMANK